ncbi:MAG: hypothetical protein HUU38_11795 [Anaerolineales bacterium]|nr:hypothetical protein [Anaerolineales bacterium]
MKRNFNDKPTAKYLKAVSMLMELLEDEGADTVKRAYAEAVFERKIQGYKRDMKAPRDSHVCVSRLKGERCPGEKCHSPVCIPGMDHVSEWRKDGKTESIVSQPYRMNLKTLKETVEFCETNGLDAEISVDESWHFPGATLFIEYKKLKEISA